MVNLKQPLSCRGLFSSFAGQLNQKYQFFILDKRERRAYKEIPIPISAERIIIFSPREADGSKNASLKAELTTLFGDQKENIEKAAGCLKVLAHPARLQIMCALRNGEQTVQDLEFLTGLRQTTLSQHLSLLKNRDVLASRREANYSFYRIANMRMVELFNLVQDMFCQSYPKS